MLNFQYVNPVRIIFGEAQYQEISKNIPAGSKILITYGGGSIKKNGVYDNVMQALNGFSVMEFGGIEANPHYETLMKAVEIVRANKIDYILAVGGGSVIDGTKFICAAALYEGDPWDFFAKRVPVQKAIPFGTVLTIPATGSEMNSGAVITKEETKEKRAFGSPLLYPKFSILDPTTTKSLPVSQRANGVADAFVHVIEQYLTFSVNAPLQDRFAESIFQTLIEIGEKYVKNLDDIETAGNLIWCATMGLNGLIGCGVPQDWATHMIGHEITALYGIDHGQTLSVILPGVMNVMREEKRAKIVQYAERVWNICEGSDDQKIDAAIEKTEAFFRSLGIKTRLSEYNVPANAADEILNALKEHKMIPIGERGIITEEKAREIIKSRM